MQDQLDQPKERKKRQPKKKALSSVASSLSEALKFASLAQKKDGQSYQIHCVMRNRTLTAFDGLLACGHTIEDDFEANPRTDILLKALSKCSDSLSITHVNDQLKIVSGGFRVNVPCEPAPLIAVKPDPSELPTDARLVASLAIVADLPEEGDERIACRSVLLQAGSCVGINKGFMVIEAWHAHDIPRAFPVPIRSIKAVLSCGKELTSLGFSDNSITFWFVDGSWIRSQLEDGKWPEYLRTFSIKTNYSGIPELFFTGVKSVETFSEDGRIRFGQNQIKSHQSKEVGAAIECEGIEEGPILAVEYLKLMQPLATKADFYTSRGCYFIGEKDGVNVRGAIARFTGE
jgi:hypothetical protein